MRWALAFAFSFSLAYAQVSSYEEGQVRVEVLSPNLVRIELKGPKGFEDRETFRVLDRDWPGAPLKNIERGKEVARLDTANWSVAIPIGAKELKGIRILDGARRTLYEVNGG